MILGSVCQNPKQNSKRYREQNVVSMVVSVDDDGARDDRSGNQGCHDETDFPEMSLTISKCFYFCVQIQEQKSCDGKGVGSVSTGIRLHGIRDIVVLRKRPLLVKRLATNIEVRKDGERDGTLLIGLCLPYKGVQARSDRGTPGYKVRAKFSNELFYDSHVERPVIEPSVPSFDSDGVELATRT